MPYKGRVATGIAAVVYMSPWWSFKVLIEKSLSIEAE